MNNKHTERTTRKYFRCEYEDHLISKFPKPPTDNEKRQKQVRFSERDNCLLHKECNNGENNNDKIYIHLWHVCLIMTNYLLGILVTVRNSTIGFYIQEQRVI